VRIDPRSGARIASPPLSNTPAYKAGLDVDDVVRQLDGTRVTSSEEIDAVLRRHKPGDTISVEFADRAGVVTQAKVVLAEDPQTELIPVESIGSALTPSQRAFRRAWLGQ
jgi:predicted metalloprotease with PDZ domain